MQDKKPYRSIYFNDERKWKRNNILDDIFQVGIHKAMGWLSVWRDDQEGIIELQEKLLVSQVKDIQEKLLANGKMVKRFFLNNNDKFWCGDKQMIQDIIDKNEDVLLKNDWKSDVEWVFNKITETDIDHEENKELYHFICELFNSWCLWCEKKIYKIDPKTKKTYFLSKSPYDPDKDFL